MIEKNVLAIFLNGPISKISFFSLKSSIHSGPRDQISQKSNFLFWQISSGNPIKLKKSIDPHLKEGHLKLGYPTSKKHEATNINIHCNNSTNQVSWMEPVLGIIDLWLVNESYEQKEFLLCNQSGIMNGASAGHNRPVIGQWTL